MSDAPERDEHGRFKRGGTAPGSIGWTPRVEIGLHDAEAVLTGGLTENAALIEMGLDPLLWEVVSYRISRWPGAEGAADKEATKLSAKRRVRPLRDTLDIDDLLQAVEAWGTPIPPRIHDTGTDAFVVNLADWQIGGTGPGGGSRETLARLLALGGSVAERATQLRLAGFEIPVLVVTGLGDLVEGCTGFYSNQPFTVDLDNRAQMKMAYMTLSALLRQWASLFSRIVVAPIAGNHGETRSAFKNETGPGDNKDILAFEIVRDVLAERKGFEHFEWQIPGSELAQVIDVAGAKLGITHGHMFSGGTNAAAKATKWWQGQMFGLQPVKDANILVSGHFHHLSMVEFSDSGRTWFQTPAMDNGSEWFTNFSGQSSAPGTLTFRMGRSCGPRMWDDLKIL